MAIRACIFDIDGTLTSERFCIPSEVQDALRELQHRGVYCTVNTANAFVQYQQLYRSQFKPNAPLILENGASIVASLWHEDYLCIHHIASSFLKELQTLVGRKCIQLFAFYKKGEGYKIFSHESPSSHLLYRTNGERVSWSQIERHWRTSPPSQVIVRLSNEDAVMALKTLSSVTFGQSDESTYEITPLHIHKGSGIRYWSEVMDIPLENIAVFGNAENDIPAFNLPVRMKVLIGDNQQLRNRATHSLSTVDEIPAFLRTVI